MNTHARQSSYWLGLVLLASSSELIAATTDISQTPLVVASPNAVKPNLLFVLDDSGSMGFDFMPDHINGTGSPDPRLCRSSGANEVDSGSFDSSCCRNGNSSQACWTGSAPSYNNRRAHPPFLSSSFNGMAYNPSTRYLPPVNSSGVSWSSMTSANTGGWTSVANDAYGIQSTSSVNLLTEFPDMEWCTDSSYSDCLRNDNYILPGRVNNKDYTTYLQTSASGSGLKVSGAPDNPSTTAQAWGPHYYKINAAEFCDEVNLRNCQSTANAVYKHPAPVRWCDSDENARAATPTVGSCQAVRNASYSHVRFPSKFFSAGIAGIPGTSEVRARSFVNIASINNASGKSCWITITAFRVKGVNILSSATSTEYIRSNLAASLMSRINNGGSGFSASLNNTTLTITAPAGVANPGAISIVSTPNTCYLTTNPGTPSFSGYQAAVAAVPGTPAGYPGSFERVDIVPSRNSYPKAATRKDCTGATCTYAEEMTNFANWWTYYRTRMQMMKSSTSLVFAGVQDDYRVGYLSINNSQGDAFLNLKTFSGAAKETWFSRLVAAKPSGGTPLRRALDTAGRLYAGKKTGSLNNETIVDPVEYSCQRNFTILSTDGFWNESITLTQLDGTTALGDQDGNLPRPKLDGNASSDTLADVAAYFQKTDLRTGSTGSDACKSGSSTAADVCGNGTASEVQRMTTYTLGLGASGYMQFRPDYLTASSGDYFSVAQGSTPNTAGGICTWQASGDCNWPTPENNTLTTIDDLWHAAVNGGGTYFSASDPATLYAGLSDALASIDAEIGASAAATTSNPNISTGDNQVFVSNFVSGEWSGELKAQRIDLSSGAIMPGDADWSARDLLNSSSGRTIYLFDGSAPSKRKAFNWASLSTTEKAYFETAHITAAGRSLSQFCNFGVNCLSAPDQVSAAGENLVRFLRGERGNEGPVSNPGKFYRERKHVLGDIINSEATYVKQPQLHLTDDGYADFSASEAISKRKGMVYVGANDGMLHAFFGETGEEAWAYVPTAVIPKLYKLADKGYANDHEYFVDGSPVIEDVKIGGQWRTLLVAGLGAGGRAYYAIDVTDPGDPKPLWEFTHNNLGYTIGKAEIAKLNDGTWVVIVPSGYNNVSPGDGNGRLFVLDAATGSPIPAIPHGIETKVGGLAVGSTTTPSGLGHIRAWADNSDLNNLALRVYGGDNLGNLWRFDINDNIAPAGYEAQRLATLKSQAGAAQPITSRPELGNVDGYAMVYVGTGRYLGISDLSDSTPQSIYAVKDRLNSSDFGDPRNAANKFVKQTLSTTTCPNNSTFCTPGESVRSNGSPASVNLAVNNGWYVDLPATRERVTLDPMLVQGILTVNSNVVDASGVCSVGGSSWINYFDYRNGAPPPTTNGITSLSLGPALATRPVVVKLPNNKLVSITRLTNAQTKVSPQPPRGRIDPAGRVSWRELSVQ